MKISIIGAGNVGGLAAMRLAQEDIAQVCLIDIAPGLAKAKVLDLEDARSLLKVNYGLSGSDDIKEVKGSDIVVVTAGLARKPGMTREDLAGKNAVILKDICLHIRELAAGAIVIVVTNPLDLMTYFALKKIGFENNKVFGMGVSLDASRFADLIAHELDVSPLEVETMVIGIHGEGMLPLPRFCSIKGVPLEEFLSEDKLAELVRKTVGRGAEIVALFGNGSAYFAPSAAILDIVKALVKDERRTVCVSAYLNGEYGIKDACLGVPCRLTRNGIEKVIELELSRQEKETLFRSGEDLKTQYRALNL